jgi:hypothetical protein
MAVICARGRGTRSVAEDPASHADGTARVSLVGDDNPALARACTYEGKARDQEGKGWRPDYALAPTAEPSPRRLPDHHRQFLVAPQGSGRLVRGTLITVGKVDGSSPS